LISQQALWGRIGAHVQHSLYDPRETTLAARRSFLDRFEKEADPNLTLDPAERARRASHLRRAYFLRLSLRSAEVRRQRANRRQPQNGGGQ
jgi:hypothetical protein